ncbi:hypothetical protein SC171_14730 [Pantoea cypripedii]|uniref:hypothetical protein n=1 Tax=Pantoea cypripedii TaxID=55209 RepID=UPI002FCA436F
MAGVSLSDEHSSLEEIEDYYVVSNNALYDFYSTSSLSTVIPARLIGLTKDEIEKEIKEKQLMLERMCSLELLSALEARIKIDYIHRVKEKFKDNLSRDFRQLHKRKQNKASLVDDLLHLRKKNINGNDKEINEFIKAIDYRNWLAHGRYWIPKKAVHIRKYDYLSIKTLAIDILSKLDLIEG